MKYLKKYERAFDADFALVKIGEHYTQSDVRGMLDTEIAEWVDDHATYSEVSNGEAEDVVICNLINWFRNEYSKELDKEEEDKLEKALKLHYSALN